MAKGNLAVCLAVTLPHEGGYTTDRRDPGNWTGGKVGVGQLKGTNMGIAAHSFPHLDIKNLTQADVIPIYGSKYWAPVRGDDLPFGVDLAVFDYGVNSGVGRAAKELQRVVGAKVDGKVGGETLKATIVADSKATIKAICARRLSFMQSLKIWETFKRGWSRRVADVEAKAMAMWIGRGAALDAQAREALRAEAEAAAGKANNQNKTAGGAVATGGGAGGVEVMTDPNWLMVGGIIVVALVIAGLLAVHARKNSERAAAYSAAAKAA